MKIAWRKLSNDRKLSHILSIWIYIYAIFYFVPLIIPSNTILMYISLVVIDIFILILIKKIRGSVIIFIVTYCMIALVNSILVSYTYYTIIEAYSGLAIFLSALLIISSEKFYLKDFIEVWTKFAVVSTLVTPIAVILVQNKTIDYGIFTYLNLPSAIIFSYSSFFKGKKINIIYLGFASINFLVILAFGGRMAAFVAFFSLFIAYLLSAKINIWTKIFVITVGIIVIFLIINNLNSVLIWVQTLLKRFNLSSRSFSLLIEQLRSDSGSIYLSRRDVLYEKVINYILTRGGLPGGFGVTLAITNGSFYHPHNLFLQLSVMLGIFGTVVFFGIVVFKVSQFKKRHDTMDYKFVQILLIDYLLISFTGGSILTNYVAIIGLAVLFYYKKDRRSTILM